jgi:crotonobetaine/carnitine-CoA ligase
MPVDLIERGDPYYSVYPAFHLSGKVALYVAAIKRGSLVLRETFSVAEFWNDMRAHKIKAAGLLGPMASFLMAMPELDDDANNPVEKVVMGPIIPNVEDFKKRFGIKHVATGYGMTEIGFPLVSGWDPPNPRTCGQRREGPPYYELRVVNDNDEPVPLGTPGELVVRSGDPWVINRGYWRQPEKTAESWRNGWWHTGDVFVEDEDGWLFFVDRKKDALRRRGENISSFEVEAGISAHPDVLEVGVVGVASEHGEDEVKAVVVRSEGSTLTEPELVEWLTPRMPKFMIPRYVEFAASLPKTDATFRTQKFVLREQGITAATWDREA